MNPSDIIPPTIQLLLTEDLGDMEDLDDFARRYRRIGKELTRQAEWSLENFSYYDKNTAVGRSLVVTASAGLNPLSIHGVCSARDCKLNTTRQVARTLGLYADVVTIPDTLSLMLADPHKLTRRDLFYLSNQILVLQELAPMIREGVFRFWSGEIPLCEIHHRAFVREVDEGVARLVKEWKPELRVKVEGPFLVVEVLDSDVDTPIFTHRLSPKEKKRLASGVPLSDLGDELYFDQLNSSVRGCLMDLNFSEHAKSTLFSTSRRELLALKAFDYSSPALTNVAAWEKARSIQLPWISELSVEQVLSLRKAASKALPAFRETFVRRLIAPDSSAESVGEAINELRAEAAELEAELKSLNPASEATFRNVNGALGITASVYGFAAGVIPPAAALGGLITLLGYLHTSARKDEQDEVKLRSKPAYVLLKAKELAAHVSHDN